MNTKKKILVMDDDQKIVLALAARLRSAGYEVLTASNGLKGLLVAVEESPDLLIMDIWMPAGMGFSVAQRLQDMHITIPIIFISGSRLEGIRDMADELGAVAFLEKPYDAEELLNTVADALKARELETV